MRAALHDATALQDHDAIRHTDCGKSVGNQDRHFPRGQLYEPLIYLEFGARVEAGGRLIEDEICASRM